jgi:hypothetical protein
MVTLHATNRATERFWLPLYWCLPTLLGFVVLLFSFPINRHIPRWFPLSLAEIFALWFLLVAPATTVYAIFILLKRPRSTERPLHAKLLVSSVVIVSVILDALVFLGLWSLSD